MTTMTHLSEERERLDFAAKAAAHFASHPQHHTYSGTMDVSQDAWFAVRWGMGQDCVLTFRVSDKYPVTVYQQAIK